MTSGSFLFNLYAPVCEYFGGSAEPTSVTIGNYQAGNFESIFSGSYILATNGKYFSDYGVSASLTDLNSTASLYINNNTYLSTGTDIQYTSIVYNFKVGVQIGFYSASTIGNITSLSILDFILKNA